jgi:hypothetical protein
LEGSLRDVRRGLSEKEGLHVFEGQEMRWGDVWKSRGDVLKKR